MKRLIPVIHIVDIEQVITNIETCLSVDVNHVFLINHLSGDKELLEIANIVKEKYPKLWIGLNFLGLHPSEVLKMDLNFDALWIDQTLTLEDIEDKKFNGEIFSGLNFKYQKQSYGDDLLEIIKTIKKTSTVACTSGSGTGKAASSRKIEELSALVEDFPMAIASGISSENIEIYLPYVDNFLVASSITDLKEIIIKDKLRTLKEKIYGV